MADLMTELLCRKEVLTKQIEETEASMKKIPEYFLRHKEMKKKLGIIKDSLEKLSLDIYRERRQVGLFDDHRH